MDARFALFEGVVVCWYRQELMGVTAAFHSAWVGLGCERADSHD